MSDHSLVLTCAVLLASLLFYAQDWLCGLANTIRFGKDPIKFCLDEQRKGRSYFRLAPGNMGGRTTYMLHDRGLIASSFAAGSALISTKALVWFDWAVFDLSDYWLAHPENFHDAAPFFYSMLATSSTEQVAEIYRPLLEDHRASLQERYSESTTIRLHGNLVYDWYTPTVQALYGPDLDLENIMPPAMRVDQDFHLFVASASVPLLPRALARRLVCGEADRHYSKALVFYQQWLDTRGQDSAFPAVTKLFDHLVKELAPGDAAKMAFAVIWSALANTSMTLFWTLVYVLSSPTIRARIETEIKSLRERGDPQDLTVTGLPVALPLLRSAMYESLRMTVSGASARLVEKATVLTDSRGHQLALKEGEFIVGLPMPSQFSDLYDEAKVWKGDRFLDADGRFDGETGFLPWGGSVGICRGRRLATFEILYTIMLLFERFDLEIGSPVDGDGQAKEPTFVPLGEGGGAKTPGIQVRIGTGVMPPAERGDVELKIKAKKAWS